MRQAWLPTLSRRRWPLARAAALAGWLAASPALAQETSPAAPSPEKDWDATVELYGFLPWMHGSTTVRGFQTETDLAPGQILDHLQSAFSARASLEKERLGVLIDVAYNQVGAEQSRTTPRGLITGAAEVTAITGVYDLAMRWRFGERESAIGAPGRWWVIPYAGLRVVQARLDVSAELQGNGPLGLRLQRQGTVDRTWAQPLLGTQASLFLSPRLRVFARGDLGGFGLAGAQDLSANGQVGVGYAIGNSTDLNVSWRYQGLRWDNGAARSNGFTSDLNGIEAGIKFYF